MRNVIKTGRVGGFDSGHRDRTRRVVATDPYKNRAVSLQDFSHQLVISWIISRFLEAPIIHFHRKASFLRDTVMLLSSYLHCCISSPFIIRFLSEIK